MFWSSILSYNVLTDKFSISALPVRNYMRRKKIFQHVQHEHKEIFYLVLQESKEIFYVVPGRKQKGIFYLGAQ